MLCVRAHGAVIESLEHVNEHRPGAWIVVKTRYLHTKWFYTGVAGRNVGIADIVDPSVVCRPVFVRINV